MPRSESLKDPELFGSLIRAKRIELGLSQHELAEKLGKVTCQYVSKLERGVKCIPPTVILIKIAIALNIDLMDLLIAGQLVEACNNRAQISQAAKFVEIWERSLDMREAVRVSHNYLASAIARKSETSVEVRNILNIVKKNVDYLFDFCFDPRKIPLSKQLQELTVIAEMPLPKQLDIKPKKLAPTLKRKKVIDVI